MLYALNIVCYGLFVSISTGLAVLRNHGPGWAAIGFACTVVSPWLALAFKHVFQTRKSTN